MREPDRAGLSDLQQLRNMIGGAASRGAAEEVARLRRRMAIGLTVRDVHRHLGDLALTREEAEEIVNAVLAHRSRAELEAEALAGAVEVSRLLRLLADQWSCDDLTQVTSA